MILQAYRGTKLSEALDLLSWKISKKASYRATDRQEAQWYADLAQRKDRYHKGSIIKADIDLPSDHIHVITSSNLDDLYDPTLPVYQTHIGKFSAEWGLDIILIPPHLNHIIRNPAIVGIVNTSRHQL